MTLFFRIFPLLLLLALSLSTTAQEPLVKDLDGDGRADSVYVDMETGVITCWLSTQQFWKTESQPIEILNENSGVDATRNGFEFYNHWMRAGYRSQFRYNSTTREMQLIGMSRYEFGNAANDGSGESSVNLLTGEYMGDWNYFDPEAKNGEGALVKMPTIQTKMRFVPTSLQTFGEDVYFGYAERCAALYEQAKRRFRTRKK